MFMKCLDEDYQVRLIERMEYHVRDRDGGIVELFSGDYLVLHKIEENKEWTRIAVEGPDTIEVNKDDRLIVCPKSLWGTRMRADRIHLQDAPSVGQYVPYEWRRVTPEKYKVQEEEMKHETF